MIELLGIGGAVIGVMLLARRVYWLEARVEQLARRGGDDGR